MGAQERKRHMNVLSQALSGFTHKRPPHGNMEGLPHCAQTAMLRRETLVTKDKAEI